MFFVQIAGDLGMHAAGFLFLFPACIVHFELRPNVMGSPPAVRTVVFPAQVAEIRVGPLCLAFAESQLPLKQKMPAPHSLALLL